jgi:Na+/proline symporter
VTLSLLLGVFLFIFYEHFPALLPADLTPDQVMPHFVNTQVPPILTGLLVAAVFAAAMSSLDSALNSLAAALTVDFLKRFRRRVTEAQRLPSRRSSSSRPASSASPSGSTRRAPRRR